MLLRRVEVSGLDPVAHRGGLCCLRTRGRRLTPAGADMSLCDASAERERGDAGQGDEWEPDL